MYSEYRDHLKQHFDDDPAKEWTHCHEPTCDSSKTLKNTIAHITGLHGFDKPFHCTMSLRDRDCAYSSTVTSNMFNHLKVVHGISTPSERNADSVPPKLEPHEVAPYGGVGGDRGDDALTTDNVLNAPKSKVSLPKKPCISDIDPYLGVYYKESADCKLCGDHFDHYGFVFIESLSRFTFH